MSKKKGAMGLLLTSIMWGGGFVATRHALDGGFSSLQINTYRFMLASILLYLLYIKRVNSNINFRTLKNGIILGALLFLPFILQTEGLKYTTGAKNAFITATNVVIVPFLAWLIYRVRISGKKILCSVMALIGIAILSLERDLSFNYGDFLTLLCAFGFALQILYVNKFSRMSEVVTLTLIQFITAAVLSAICMLILDPSKLNPTPLGIGGLIYLAVFSTLAGFLLLTVCSRVVSGTSAALILSTESVFGTFFSWLMLGEAVTLKILIGSIIIFVAIIASEVDFSDFKNARIKYGKN